MHVQVAGEPGFGKMVRQMNKFMDQLQKGYFSFCPTETWTPTVNVYEGDSAYFVCVDLSGVEKEKIDLQIDGTQLRLRGNRAVPSIEEDGPEAPPRRMRVHLMEIDHGPFTRQVDLPANIDRDRINATYRNGMLWVEVPKK